jgi:AcrR family transcriptional regulator
LTRRESSRDRGGGPGPERPRVELPPALSKLPAARDQVPRGLIRVSQRTRLLGAALVLFGEQGFARTSASALIKEAGTSPTTFYALFADKSACFLAAYEVGLERLEEAARTGIDQADGWPLQLRGATAAVLALLAADPRLARLCAVEAHLAGPEVHARRQEMAETVAQGLRRGRRGRPEARKLPDLLEPVLVGGAAALIADAVADGGAGTLPKLAPELTELLLSFYLGPVEARRVARGR